VNPAKPMNTTVHMMICGPYVSFPDCIGVHIVIWHIILVVYKKPTRSISKFVRVFIIYKFCCVWML